MVGIQQMVFSGSKDLPPVQRGAQTTSRHKECKVGAMARAQNPTTQEAEATRSMQVRTTTNQESASGLGEFKGETSLKAP